MSRLGFAPFAPFALLTLASCMNFDAAYEDCQKPGGRCFDAGTSGGGGAVGGGTGGDATGGGSGGGSVGGGTGGGATGGGATGGGATGGGATGGGATGGGGGTGGTFGDPRASWPLDDWDAGTWVMTAKTPAQAQQPPEYGGLAGRVTADGGATLWSGDRFGDVKRFDGTWSTLSSNSGLSVDQVLAEGSTVYALALTKLWACNGSCTSGGGFTPFAPSGFSLSAVCARGGTTWVVGKSSSTGTIVAVPFSGGFGSVVTSSQSHNVFGCHVAADGTLLVAGDDLWHLDVAGGDLVVDSAPGTSESDMFWRGFVESGAGEVYAFGTYERVAHRQSDGSWRVVRQLSAQPDWLDAAVRLPSGDVLFLGERVDPINFAQGTQELLLLSESAQAFFSVSRPSGFTVRSAFAPTDGVLWLAGYTRQGSGSSTGAIFRAVR